MNGGAPSAPAAPAASASDGGLSLEAAAAEIGALSDDYGDDESGQPRDDRGRYARRETAQEGDEGDADREFDLDTDADPDALEADDADGEEVEAEAEPVFKVVVDGEEREVTQSELVKGYSLGEAAYKRMSEAAQVRKQADEYARQATVERQAYTQLLHNVGAFLESQAPSAQMIEQMMLQDPVEGYRAREVRDQILSKAAEFRHGFEAMTRAAAAYEQRQLQEELKAAQAQLPVVVPEWKDSARAQKELPEIYTFMVREGFQHEELARITDARAMKIARKAWLFDRLQAKGKMPVAQAQGRPGPDGARQAQPQRPGKPAPRSLPPGSRAQPSKSRAAQAIADRARATGSLEDVAAWIGVD